VTAGPDAACLRRLDATGLLVRSRRGIGFRHELARRAVRTSIPLGAESGLHARLRFHALDQVVVKRRDRRLVFVLRPWQHEIHREHVVRIESGISF